MELVINELDVRLNDIERYNRSFNLRFLNVPVERDEDPIQTVANIGYELGLSIDYCDIENAHRIPIRLLAPDNIGSSLAKTAHPVLIARFYSRPLRHTVLVAKSNLKYLNDRHPLKYINIVEDLSKRNATIYRLARAKLSKQNKHKIYS
ncbi:unnamed protein product, partial [Didymodactylos carnosus]